MSVAHHRQNPIESIRKITLDSESGPLHSPVRVPTLEGRFLSLVKRRPPCIAAMNGDTQTQGQKGLIYNRNTLA
jgi:hypothetical protein